MYPVRVQGDEAAGEIAAALRDINAWGGFDVIVLARGGGSLEDLWAFNEEIVARAVADSAIPVVSAVGHETDFTIADFVADLRAPTPSAAAELVFREKAELAAHLERTVRRMSSAVKSQAVLARERLAHCRTRLGDPARVLGDIRLRVDDLTEDLTEAARRGLVGRRQALAVCEARLRPLSPVRRVAADRQKLIDLERRLRRGPQVLMDGKRNDLAGATRRLNDLSPLAVLGRGYSLTRRKADGRPVRSSKEVTVGDRLDVLLSRGALEVIVDEVKE